MVNCKECIFYDAEYDELRQSGNDTGKPLAHYCRMYKDGIPNEVWDNLHKCPENPST